MATVSDITHFPSSIPSQIPQRSIGGGENDAVLITCTVVSRASAHFRGKRPCTPFQGVNVAVSIQTYGILIPGKRPCRPKLRVMFKRPWALTRDTTVISYLNSAFESVQLLSYGQTSNQQGSLHRWNTYRHIHTHKNY